MISSFIMQINLLGVYPDVTLIELPILSCWMSYCFDSIHSGFFMVKLPWVKYIEFMMMSAFGNEEAFYNAVFASIAYFFKHIYIAFVKEFYAIPFYQSLMFLSQFTLLFMGCGGLKYIFANYILLQMQFKKTSEAVFDQIYTFVGRFFICYTLSRLPIPGAPTSSQPSFNKFYGYDEPERLFAISAKDLTDKKSIEDSAIDLSKEDKFLRQALSPSPAPLPPEMLYDLQSRKVNILYHDALWSKNERAEVNLEVMKVVQKKMIDSWNLNMDMNMPSKLVDHMKPVQSSTQTSTELSSYLSYHSENLQEASKNLADYKKEYQAINSSIEYGKTVSESQARMDSHREFLFKLGRMPEYLLKHTSNSTIELSKSNPVEKSDIFSGLSEFKFTDIPFSQQTMSEITNLRKAVHFEKILQSNFGYFNSSLHNLRLDAEKQIQLSKEMNGPHFTQIVPSEVVWDRLDYSKAILKSQGNLLSENDSESPKSAGLSLSDQSLISFMEFFTSIAPIPTSGPNLLCVLTIKLFCLSASFPRLNK